MLKWFKGKPREVVLTSPMTGRLLGMEAIPDPAFSNRMLGDGFAIHPTAGQVLAPCAGTVTQLFPTSHALGLLTPEGLEILIHIGIDTVEMKGAGFTRLVEAGDAVTAGTPLLQVALEVLEAHGKSPVTPVVITNMERVERMLPTGESHVRAGITPVMRVILK